MEADAHFPAPLRLRSGLRDARAGLTLVEVMISCAMISLTCTAFMFVFTQLNQMAMISRLYTGAYAVAQSQIDHISTDGPFEPEATDPVVPPPAALTVGTTTTPVTIYQDPISNNTVTGTMTTVVAPLNTVYTSGATSETLYLYKATVTVAYSYRNRNYSVSFSTLRTSDA
jgi:type II secretory pathway pseudopilin PulG